MSGSDIDMRIFAKNVGTNVNFSAGSIVFNKGDTGSCLYVVQSGVIEMVIGDKVIEVCGPDQAIGFMSMVDGAPRSSTARVKEASVAVQKFPMICGRVGRELLNQSHTSNAMISSVPLNPKFATAFPAR